MRIDKWLWTVRLFKTRTQASDACKGGKVKLGGTNVKSSREIHVDDIIEIQQQTIKKIVKILQFPKSRLGAKLVDDYMKDLTPTEEYERLEMMRQLNHEKRDRGDGRPTKKDRRDIEKLKEI